MIQIQSKGSMRSSSDHCDIRHDGKTMIIVNKKLKKINIKGTNCGLSYPNNFRVNKSVGVFNLICFIFNCALLIGLLLPYIQ